MRHSTSYRIRSFLFFLALVLVALTAISIAFYQSNRSFLSEYIREINYTQAQAWARLLDSVFYRASYASAAIAERSTVRTYLSGRTMEEAGTPEAEQAIQDLVSLFASANSEISSIYVYCARRGRIVTDRLSADIGQFHDREWLTQLPATDATRPILVYREDPVFGTPMITIARRIDEGDRFAGGVVVNLHEEDLRRLVGRRLPSAGEGLYVIQDESRVVFATHDSDLDIIAAAWAGAGAGGQAGAAYSAEEESVFLARASGEIFNLDYVSASGSALFQEKIRQLRRFLIIVLGSVVLLGSGVSLILARFAYRPIRDIVDTIEHPDRHTNATSDDEIRFIENSIIRIMASNRRLEQRLADRFQSLRRAHYAALQLQINPHFLYNTLESIYWNSMEAFSPEDSVPRSVSSLSRFLRMILATDSVAIPMAEEIEITRQYLTLLEIRFGDLLTVRWNVPESMGRIRVPKLLLQPLVENAFYHGIKPLRRPGTIEVSARSAKGRVEIHVTDDGAGMSEKRTKAVANTLTQDIGLGEDHIGLLNVAQRLRILYGQEAEIRIESREGVGTTVSISVPNAPGDGEVDKITPPM